MVRLERKVTADHQVLRARLLGWYRKNRRDLPWRRTRDPYAVWISEVMLQQTRVDTVIPYYDRFLAKFPTVDALAGADPAEVRASWSGLGYYRRAELMLRAASSIVRDHASSLPADKELLLGLPGFGRYTAGAVASIAFGLEAGAVDGNVTRVLSRLFAIKDANPAEVWEHAEALAKGEAPGELNQGLIELGALLCSPRSPKCLLCPVAALCAAKKAGLQEQIPPPKKRAEKKKLEVTALLLFDRRGRLILERQPAGGLFAELWCLPMLEGALEPDAATDEADRKYSWSLDQVEHAARVKHVLTHREIAMTVVRARTFGGKLPDTMTAIELDALETLGIPSMTVRALKAAMSELELSRAVLPGRRTKHKPAFAEQNRRTHSSARPSNKR
jgi:A/G-specific adenine glycosylase